MTAMERNALRLLLARSRPDRRWSAFNALPSFNDALPNSVSALWT
jgi:hypothetical protein